MTEVQRIIQEGIVPESFLKPEVCCDFYVDETRKKIWTIQLDLLYQVDKICRKYKIKYFLFWGSLLGSVRHKGFIPWDDDLDIALLREDYEKLMNHKDEFSYPYFLQTPFTDKGYYYAHAKLRNSNTTALDYPFLFQGFNMGIFIDIIPLDYINPTNAETKFLEAKKYILDNNIAMRLKHPYLNERDKLRVKNFKGGDGLDSFKKIETIVKSDKKEDKVAALIISVYGLDRESWESSLFDEIIECDYNGIKTFIPKGYEKILKITYGDYMKMPPTENRGVWHSNLYFNPDVPYLESLENWEQFYDKDNPNTNQMTKD